MSADVMERILALEAEQRALYEQAAAENKQKLVVARHTLERRDEDRRRISESEGSGTGDAGHSKACRGGLHGAENRRAGAAGRCCGLDRGKGRE